MIPPIEQKADGWCAQRWQVRIGSPVLDEPDELSRQIEGAAIAALRSDFRTRGEERNDPIRVTCHPYAGSSLNVVVEVRSEHPDWRLGAFLATIQAIDQRFGVTHLEDVPRQDLRPWFLANGGRSG